MLSGFKDFIMRGNVIELAVAVIIGAAFTDIVTAVSEKIINPLIASLGGSPEVGLGFYLREGNKETFLDFGAVITAGINFLIIAAVIYFILIAPMNKIAELSAKNKGLDEDVAGASDNELLAEIRDLLAAQNGLPTSSDKSTGRHAE